MPSNNDDVCNDRELDVLYRVRISGYVITRGLVAKCEGLYLQGYNPQEIIDTLKLPIKKSTFMRGVYKNFTSDVSTLKEVYLKSKNRRIKETAKNTPREILQDRRERGRETHAKREYSCKCEVCGVTVKGKQKGRCSYCKGRKKREKMYGIYGLTYVLCPYCNKPKRFITGKHLELHGESWDTIEEDYPGWLTCCADVSVYRSENGIASYYNDTDEYRTYRGRKEHYERPDGTTVRLRSSWELKVARSLDRLGLTWTYETKKFKYIKLNGRPGNYTPDFILENEKLVIEVKPRRFIFEDENMDSKVSSCVCSGYDFAFATEDEVLKSDFKLDSLPRGLRGVRPISSENR